MLQRYDAEHQESKRAAIGRNAPVHLSLSITLTQLGLHRSKHTMTPGNRCVERCLYLSSVGRRDGCERLCCRGVSCIGMLTCAESHM